MDILNPNRDFVIGHEITKGHTLYGKFPTPSQERTIASEILRRLDGRAPAQYENPDIPLRVRIACELNVAIHSATDPQLLRKIGDWEDFLDDEILVAVWNEYNRLKSAFYAELEKKAGQVLELLTDDRTLLMLRIFERTGRLPARQTVENLYPAQIRFLILAHSYLTRTGWKQLEDRALLTLRVQTLESSGALDLLPDGMAFRLQMRGIRPEAQAEARRRRMIEQARRELDS